MTGRSRESVETFRRRRASISCVQEIKWKENKAKMIGYKILYTGKKSEKNKEGIILDE